MYDNTETVVIKVKWISTWKEVAVYILGDFIYDIKLYLWNMGLSSHVLVLLPSFQEKFDKWQT